MWAFLFSVTRNRRRSQAVANDVIETNTYHDARGWLQKREYKQDATTLFFVENTIMDAAGNIKQQQYQHQGGSLETLNYDYDDLHQITEFKDGANVIQQYNYDPNGNRNTLSGYGAFTYGNSNNRLTSHNDGSTTKSYTFDRTGRVKQIDSDALAYDAFNNMTAYGSDTYTYDAYGQRLRKTEDGTTKYYVTSGPTTLAEHDGSGNLQAEYIYGLRGMVAQLDPSKGYLWLFTDHLGSTRHVDNSTMQRDYTPYGENYTAAGNDDVPYQFTGKELDTGIGLHYFGARYYDARIGRWLVQDPARQFWSPYVYGGNNPLSFVDPDGELAWFVPILIGAGIGATAGGIIAHNNGQPWWQGAIVGGFIGVGVGSFAASAIGATGVGTAPG